LSDACLSVRIRAIFEASAGTYGAPRIHAALAETGIRVARKRVARLMRAAGLKARSARIYRHMPGTRVFFAAIPNRILERQTTAPNQIWVGDVTYLKVGGQWRYLAVVMDRHSRRILGSALALQRDLRLTLAALNQALRRRKPAPGLVFHSDRGVEYSAYAYRARLAALRLVQSMNRPRELTDNAFMESFWHSMKSEVIHTVTFNSDAALIKVIGRYLRRYNRRRLHSALGYRSPIDYERIAA
jgi:transposase InsO family protein